MKPKIYIDYIKEIRGVLGQMECMANDHKGGAFSKNILNNISAASALLSVVEHGMALVRLQDRRLCELAVSLAVAQVHAEYEARRLVSRIRRLWARVRGK